MRSFFHFLKAALKNPLRVSTVFETGNAVAGLLASIVPVNPPSPVVELGVGTGAITEFLLEKMGNPSRYIGFELDDSMVKYVSKRFPQARFIQGSAETFATHLNGERASAVVSSLPWTLMPPEQAKAILQAVAQNLNEGGAFATYITLHVLKTPAGRRMQADLSAIFTQVQTEIIANNLPPAKVFIARK